MGVPGAGYPGGSTFTEETMNAETPGIIHVKIHAKSKKITRKNLNRQNGVMQKSDLFIGIPLSHWLKKYLRQE
jgi:hypothetical protein